MAIFCPLISKLVELRRCVRGLKYPSEMEKVEAWLRLGEVIAWVKLESSRARIRPRAVTVIAANLVSVGMVIGGVFTGRMKDVMSRPIIMLPAARRVMGLMTAGLFSLIGVVGGVRVNPVWVRRVMRRLYVAVNDVASRVIKRAHVFK